MNKESLIEALIDLAIEEDIESGDISTDAIIPVKSKATALMTAKADGVISGLEVIRKVYERFEDDFGWKEFVHDGDKVKKGDKLIEFDRQAIADEGFNTVIPMVICNSDAYEEITPEPGKDVVPGDTIITLKKQGA